MMMLSKQSMNIEGPDQSTQIHRLVLQIAVRIWHKRPFLPLQITVDSRNPDIACLEVKIWSLF